MCIYIKRGTDEIKIIFNTGLGREKKHTCVKPKAAKRPESASEASSTQPEVYSSQSEHMPEAPTYIRPGVNNSRSEELPVTKFQGIINTPGFKGWDGWIKVNKILGKGRG